PERAFGLVTKGCEGGVALACFAQANMLYRGDGVTGARERAVALLERTCDGGSVESCFLLGRIHLAMREVPAAIEAFTRAAGDDAESRREGGLRVGHKKHVPEAEPFLAAACSAGDRHACAAEGRLLVISGKRIDVA